ncbi:MAG: hypothetical protein QNI87_05895 [Erythrobacter sp.]|uniref:hypothetical protein n=1 Tax=Erythrobacter sp. TaxID=1042 RepID=UPI00262C244E|nr:hypothetical protein [Erythrobacter sp.]MDJ0978049.1 hypothetical protein [Erythrobacter sp.]
MHRVTVLAALAISIPAGGAAPLAACNPEDCGKGTLSAEEAKRDREITRRLNSEELRYVSRRDAEYANQRERSTQALRNYERERADYERRLAEWREAVRRCEAGERQYCGG